MAAAPPPCPCPCTEGPGALEKRRICSREKWGWDLGSWLPGQDTARQPALPPQAMSQATYFPAEIIFLPFLISSLEDI